MKERSYCFHTLSIDFLEAFERGRLIRERDKERETGKPSGKGWSVKEAKYEKCQIERVICPASMLKEH